VNRTRLSRRSIAEEALKGRGKLDSAEIERLESLVRFTVAQLGVKRKRR
jgi:hypothetical protein